MRARFTRWYQERKAKNKRKKAGDKARAALALSPASQQPRNGDAKAQENKAANPPIATKNIYQNLSESVADLQAKKRLEEVMAPTVYRHVIGLEAKVGRYSEIPQDKRNRIYHYLHTLNLLMDFQKLMDAISEIHGTFVPMLKEDKGWLKKASYIIGKRHNINEQVDSLGEKYGNIILSVQALELDRLGRKYDLKLRPSCPKDKEIIGKDLYLYRGENDSIWYAIKKTKGIIVRDQIGKEELGESDFKSLLSALQKAAPNINEVSLETREALRKIVSKRGHAPASKGILTWLMEQKFVKSVTDKIPENPFVESFDKEEVGDHWRQLLGFQVASGGVESAEVEVVEEKEFDENREYSSSGFSPEGQLEKTRNEARKLIKDLPDKASEVELDLIAILGDLTGTQDVSPEVRKNISRSIAGIVEVVKKVNAFSTSSRGLFQQIKLILGLQRPIRRLIVDIPQCYFAIMKMIKDHLLVTARQVNLILRDWTLQLDGLEGELYFKDGLLPSFGENKKKCGLFLMKTPLVEAEVDELLGEQKDAYIISGDDLFYVNRYLKITKKRNGNVATETEELMLRFTKLMIKHPYTLGDLKARLGYLEAPVPAMLGDGPCCVRDKLDQRHLRLIQAMTGSSVFLEPAAPAEVKDNNLYLYLKGGQLKCVTKTGAGVKEVVLEKKEENEKDETKLPATAYDRLVSDLRNKAAPTSGYEDQTQPEDKEALFAICKAMNIPVARGHYRHPKKYEDRDLSLSHFAKRFNAWIEGRGYQFKPEERYPYTKAKAEQRKQLREPLPKVEEDKAEMEISEVKISAEEEKAAVDLEAKFDRIRQEYVDERFFNEDRRAQAETVEEEKAVKNLQSQLLKHKTSVIQLQIAARIEELREEIAGSRVLLTRTKARKIELLTNLSVSIDREAQVEFLKQLKTKFSCTNEADGSYSLKNLHAVLEEIEREGKACMALTKLMADGSYSLKNLHAVLEEIEREGKACMALTKLMMQRLEWNQGASDFDLTGADRTLNVNRINAELAELEKPEAITACQLQTVRDKMKKEAKQDAKLLADGRTGKLLKSLEFVDWMPADRARFVSKKIEELLEERLGAPYGFFATSKTKSLNLSINALKELLEWLKKPGYRVTDIMNKIRADFPEHHAVLISKEKAVVAQLIEADAFIPDLAIGKRNDFGKEKRNKVEAVPLARSRSPSISRSSS